MSEGPDGTAVTAAEKSARIDAAVEALQGRLMEAMYALDLKLALNTVAAIVEEFCRMVEALKEDPGVTEEAIAATVEKISRGMEKTAIINEASEIIAMEGDAEMWAVIETMSERMGYIWDTLAELRYKLRHASAAVTFTDQRDGKTYRAMKIGSLTWMAENLNFETERSRCHGDNEKNCQKYGRLYDWDDAMKACPKGWRLPSEKDWDNLARVVGGKRKSYQFGGYYWEFAGKKLKSESGWESDRDGSGGNGTDKFGFSARPGGAYHGDSFTGYGKFGSWWSTGEDSTNCAWKRSMGIDYDNPQGDAICAWKWSIDFYSDNVSRSNVPKAYLLSLRCVECSAAIHNPSRP